MSDATQDTTSSAPLSWLREDIKEIREHMKMNSETLVRVGVVMDGIEKRIDEHCKDRNVHTLPPKKNSDTSIIPPSYRRGSGFVQAARVWGPALLAAALGLLGLGAYFGSGGNNDATARAIRAVSDQTAKLAKDIEKIQAASDAGDAR